MISVSEASPDNRQACISIILAVGPDTVPGLHDHYQEQVQIICQDCITIISAGWPRLCQACTVILYVAAIDSVRCLTWKDVLKESVETFFAIRSQLTKTVLIARKLAPCWAGWSQSTYLRPVSLKRHSVRSSRHFTRLYVPGNYFIMFPS
jgi:hypothetical protein